MYRQSIVSELLLKLEEIKINNGFYSDAGANVLEWFDKPLEEEDFPALIVRDPSDNVVDSTSLEHKLKIEIDIAHKGKNCIWNMRETSSDVLKAFKNLEDLIGYQCKYLGSESLVEQKEKLYSGMRLEFEIIYHTRRWEQ